MTRVISGYQEIIRRQKATPYFQLLGSKNSTSLDIFKTFLQELECVPTFEWWQHAASSSYFATKSVLADNHTGALVPTSIDSVIRHEALEEGLASNFAARKSERSFPRENVLPRKEETTRDSLAQLLKDDLNLQQSVCRVYIQDYLCFGYPLPKTCLSLL